MRPLFLTASALALTVAPAFADAPPATPDTRGRASTPAPMPAPTVTVAQFLKKLPGEWAGDQHMRNPKGQIMTMHVRQVYRETTRNEIAGVAGEVECVIGAGDKAKTFHSTSFTWVDDKGRGIAEVTQNGKTMRYRAFISGDSLVFIPEPAEGDAAKREKPTSGTGVRHAVENGVEHLRLKGFQTAPDGVYLVEGKLKKVK